MGLSVSGLVSGLDVPTIVSQLMQSESLPQTMLQNQLTAVQTDAKAYRDINTKFSAVLSAAKAMTDSSAWSATTASSSAASVAVASDPTAQAGSLTFAVRQTAVAQSLISKTQWSATDAAYGASSIEVHDSTGKDVGAIAIGGSGTLADAVSAINQSSFGLTATLVQVSPGQYKLQVTAKNSGAGNAFTFDDMSGFTVASTGTDAQLWVGDPTNGYGVSSPTNTFTRLVPGVTLTVSRPESAATVSVASDPSAVASKMQALVDAANSALSLIAKDTDTSTGSKAPLIGDYPMQSLAQQVLGAVSKAVGTLGSPAQVGVELTSDGQITFDQTAFVSALKSDPTLAQQLVKGTSATPGIAGRLQTLAASATDSVTGTLVTLANGQDSRAKDLQSQIDDWTVRLTARQQQLTAQYTALQTALSSLQNQSSWLTSMFNAFSSSSSSSSKPS